VSKKRGGRRGRARPSAGEHEYLFTRRVIITCLVAGHKLGWIFQDAVRTEVHVEGDNKVQQNLWRVDGRLYGSCVRCASQGIRQRPLVRWERIEHLLQRMRSHGPQYVTVELAAEAIEKAAPSGVRIG
jgi:hypothetical protein